MFLMFCFLFVIALDALKQKGLLCLSLESVKGTNFQGWWQLLKETKMDWLPRGCYRRSRDWVGVQEKPQNSPGKYILKPHQHWPQSSWCHISYATVQRRVSHSPWVWPLRRRELPLACRLSEVSFLLGQLSRKRCPLIWAWRKHRAHRNKEWGRRAPAQGTVKFRVRDGQAPPGLTWLLWPQIDHREL